MMFKSWRAPSILGFVLVVTVVSGLGAAAKPALSRGDPRFQSAAIEVPLFDEKDQVRPYVADIDGMQIVGADIGPKNGRPVVLVGGFTSSFPYLRKFVRSLSSAGFRVFVYNPPGQGRGELESRGPEELLGIDGMLRAYEAVRHHAFSVTGGKKVVAIGHSLGGLQVRAGSLGIKFTKDGHAYVDGEAQKRARRETALVVPMFSMPIFGDDAIDQATKMKSVMLKDFTPFITECVANVGCLLPWPLNVLVQNVSEKFVTTYLRHTQSNILKGLFGAKDLDHKELEELGRFLLPQKVSDQIRKDLARWLEAGAFTTNSGLDLGKAWQDLQATSKALPVLYVAGEHDGLTEMKYFASEAMAVESAHLVVVESGHLGAYLSETLPESLAVTIAHAGTLASKGSCRQWLTGFQKIAQKLELE